MICMVYLLEDGIINLWCYVLNYREDFNKFKNTLYSNNNNFIDPYYNAIFKVHWGKSNKLCIHL